MSTASIHPQRGMQTGLSVPLDPLGGNQLNIREVLRLVNPTTTPAPDDADDAGMEDGAPPAPGPVEREAEPVGRRSALDDYDYDDDFIDDAELVEEEQYDQLAEGEYDENADEDFRIEDAAVSDSENDQADGPSPVAQGKRVSIAPMQHNGFGNFFVNRGNIPSKHKQKSTQSPSSKLGNVNLDHLRLPSQQAPASNDKLDPAKPINTEDKEKPQKQENGKGQSQIGLSQKSNPVTQEQPKKETNPQGVINSNPQSNAVRPSNVKLRPVPPTLLEEISKLERVCREEFGDKKPKLQDPKVQDQLHVIFKKAIEANVARLFSDIAKDKRIVSLNDEVWVRLSRFLRTKRANLEQLGHALHWSSEEKESKTRVEQAESAVAEMLKQTLESQTKNPTEGSMKSVVWVRMLDERMYEWYKARCDLQQAKNQLASRPKSVKKSLGAWVSALKAKSFVGFNVADQEIMDSFRRIEEEKRAQERQKRDAERLERKRKKEEMAAAVAAKRAATAQTKSVSTSSTAPPATTVGTSLPSNKTSDVDLKVVKTIAKPGTNGKSTPSKLNPSKLVKHGSSTSTPSGPSPASQKQSKLTSLIKKTSKADGLSTPNSKPNTPITVGAQKTLSSKTIKPGTQTKANPTKANQGKSGSGKSLAPKVPIVKPGTSSNSVSRVTLSKTESPVKAMPAKPNSSKAAQKKSTSTKPIAGKPTATKVAATTGMTPKQTTPKRVNPLKVNPLKTNPPQVNPLKANPPTVRPVGITEQAATVTSTAKMAMDNVKSIKQTPVSDSPGDGKVKPTSIANILQTPPYEDAHGSSNSVIRPSAPARRTSEPVTSIRNLTSPTPVEPPAPPEKATQNTQNQIVAAEVAGADVAHALSGHTGILPTSSSHGENESGAAMPRSSSKDQFEVIELD